VKLQPGTPQTWLRTLLLPEFPPFFTPFSFPHVDGPACLFLEHVVGSVSDLPGGRSSTARILRASAHSARIFDEK
jgi:hypothetical protein